MSEAGWFPDPSGLHERRYFDGAKWTDDVADGDRQSRDPGRSAGGPRVYATGGGPVFDPRYIVVAQPPAGNGSAVAALTLGIIAVVIALSAFGYVVGGICGILALVFGVMGWRNVRDRGAALGGLATAGVVLGTVAIVLASWTWWNWRRLDNAISHAIAAQTGPNAAEVRVVSCSVDPQTGAPVATGTLQNVSTGTNVFQVKVTFRSDPTSPPQKTVTASMPEASADVPSGGTITWSVRADGSHFRPVVCTAVPARP
jgi:hypothetical protein